MKTSLKRREFRISEGCDVKAMMKIAIVFAGLWLWLGSAGAGQIPAQVPQGNSISPGGNLSPMDRLRQRRTPDDIMFSSSVTNTFVTNRTMEVNLTIVQGTPKYLAVLVDEDDEKFHADMFHAQWQDYASSNFDVTISSREGWHSVWIGLRGSSTNGAQDWQRERLYLDFTPPMLVITNPASNLVSVPMIQLKGYCPEALSTIRYDLSNAVQVLSDQEAYVTDTYYDSRVGTFTTNYFECVDVPLAKGLNVITMHASDLAGNIMTTNFNFTLDYSKKTNPPTIQIGWPQNEMKITGTNFTCDGWISDPTAKISAKLIGPHPNADESSGRVDDEVYPGLVERDGRFWLEDLPVIAGTNTFAITATDVVGNTSTTNLIVVQSTLTLTMDPVPESQLWQMKINMSGKISEKNYAVWVNGVKGHNNGDGTWSAKDVPMSKGGTATFEMTAFGPNERQPDGSFGN